MGRSLKKGLFISKKLQQKVAVAKESGGRAIIKTWSRASVITPEMVNLTIGVYNGKKHVQVLIMESMVGHRLGEFSLTRTFKGHAKKGKISKIYGGSGRFEDAGRS